jgi:pimeloyl-ACP methyl ester carboxylesterase
MRIVFLHGAFVRDGAWWWEPVASLVREQSGVGSVAVSMPSCGEDAGPPTGEGLGLVEDAAALASVLDAGDAIVVALSYGGTVVAEVGPHPAIRHLVYVSSVLPEVGTPHATHVLPDVEPLPVAVDERGALQILVEDRAAFDARFLHDVDDPAVVAGAHERLCAQSPAAFVTPTTNAAWKHHPSTYIVCGQDRSTSPALQREHAARATHTVELPTSHHPFQSRPDLVASVIVPLVNTSMTPDV